MGITAQQAISVGLTPYVPADLTSNMDVQITPEIQAQANQMGKDTAAIFAYVRNNIDYQPYFGSVKGSHGTYLEKAGNDADQASLLVALLRASGIPAKYVAGVVELPIEKIMNWVGVGNAMADADVFQGMESHEILSPEGRGSSPTCGFFTFGRKHIFPKILVQSHPPIHGCRWTLRLNNINIIQALIWRWLPGLILNRLLTICFMARL